MRTESDSKSTREAASDDTHGLRECLDGLASLKALPPFATSAGPSEIIEPLLDKLLEILRVAFVFVRLAGPNGPIETSRIAGPIQPAPQKPLGETLDASFGTAPATWPSSAKLSLGDLEVSVACSPLGHQGEIGVLVAASPESSFPAVSERLLLDAAADQAAIGLQQAQLLSGRKRLAELDAHAAKQASALAAANEELKAEIAGHRRAEADLLDVERESRLIVDTIPGMVAVFSTTGNIELLNNQMLQYFGKTSEEIKEWAINDIFHPEDRPLAIDTFTRALATGDPYELEARLRRFDGLYQWFLIRGLPFCDRAGHVVRWYALITGIDELKRAQEAIRLSEQDLKVIVNTIPVLVWSARPDGSAEFLNQHYLDFTGLTAEQAAGIGWTVAVHPDDLQRLVATWQSIMDSGQSGEFEARLRRVDGEYRWFLFRANPLRDDSGKVIHWYGVNTDVEDRKNAEAGVLRAYGHLSEAQRLSQIGSFTADLMKDEHAWSDEFYRICEFEPGSEVNIQRLRDIVHPDDVPLYEGAIGRALAGADSRFEFRIVTSKGVKHLRGAAHRIEQITGPVFVGAIHDVTATKDAEEALNRARSELAHVARVATLSTLTASVAHEVNQPLSGIITNANTCLRMLDSEPPNIDGARETAKRTIRDGNRAASVVFRVRALFSKREFTLESMDLNEATREVIALSMSELQRNRVILKSELAEDLPPVTGDRIQLQQVILNLIRNACDAMAGVEERPRQMAISTVLQDDDSVCLTVRDAGVGVDPQSVEKLFHAFYTTKSGGMGIGLSVSHSIIDRHHGRIWAEPNEGPGVTFSFSIPSAPVVTGASLA